MADPKAEPKAELNAPKAVSAADLEALVAGGGEELDGKVGTKDGVHSCETKGGRIYSASGASVTRKGGLPQGVAKQVLVDGAWVGYDNRDKEIK